MRDWLLTALLSHPDATVLREIADWPSVLPPSSMTDTIKVTLQGESDEIPRRSTDESADTIREVQESAETIETERFSYQYPYIGLSETPVKLSVSELKRRTMPDTEYVPSVLPHRLPMVTEYTSLGAAERGTIVHYVMQHIDFGRVSTVSEVDEQLEQMVKTGLICEKQRRVVSAEKIWSFFESELGRRLTSATHHEREFDFYMEVPAKAVTTGLNADEAEEAVLLQGIADCFFYEEDGVVLIDYKTDAIRPDEAEERAKFYQTQIEYYTEGLQSVLECPIKERYLYFLHCGCAVAV